MKPIALIATLLAATACGPQPTGEVHGAYDNKNNGNAGRLTFRGASVAALGDDYASQITHETDGAALCETMRYARNPGGLALDGTRTAEECSDRAPPSPVKRVVAAECLDTECLARVEGDRAIVHATTAGSKRFRVTVELENGQQLSDESHVYFSEVTRLDVACWYDSPCPVPHGVMVGATLELRVTAGTGAGSVPFTFSAEPADRVRIAPATYEPKNLKLTMLKPGPVTLTAKAGRLTRSWTFEVASPDDVVSGSVHALAPGADIYFGSTWLLGTDMVGPATSSARRHMVLLWTLKSGGTALGDGNQVGTSTSGYEPRTRQKDFAILRSGGGCVKQQVVATAAAGVARLSWPLDDLCDW